MLKQLLDHQNQAAAIDTTPEILHCCVLADWLQDNRLWLAVMTASRVSAQEQLDSAVHVWAQRWCKPASV